MNRAEERKRAADLKALDVRELIRATLPEIPALMSASQIDQLQRVVDAAVINANVVERYEQLDRLTIKGRNQSGQPVRDPRDPNIARRDQVLKQKVAVRPAEGAVHLELKKLLTHDGLKPTSDNPDEAAYLLEVAHVYETQGVYLLLEEDSSAVAKNLPPNNPKHWRVQLLLGYKPGAVFEPITTATGKLNRKALLSVTRLGAGYYKRVHQGATDKMLSKAMDKLSTQINQGRQEYLFWRPTPGVSVARVSDLLGGAHYPPERTWTEPHHHILQARNLKNGGQYRKAFQLTILAGVEAAVAAELLNNYVAATKKGAARAVSVLNVLQVAGEVSQILLAVFSIASGLFRLLSVRGGAAAAGEGAGAAAGGEVGAGATAGGEVGAGAEAAASPAPPVTQRAGVRYPTNYQGQEAYNSTVVQANQTLETTGAGAFNRVDAATRERNTRFYRQFFDWLVKNPNASLAEKNAQLEKLNQVRWGAPFPTD